MSQIGFDLTSGTRPAYRVPTMEELRLIPGNGYTAVGSFSGCGGSSTGFYLSGWRMPYVIEFVPAAADSYALNYPGTFIDRRDIREVRGGEILERLGLGVGDLDCYEGSPPCSSFSAAGTGPKDWGKTKRYSDTSQRTDDLFEEYIRLIREMRPRSFVAENVPGLLRGAALKEYAYRFSRLMAELGYRVVDRLLNAAQFGAAQDRSRLIFLGLRDDLGIAPSLPYPDAPEPPYSIAEALDLVEAGGFPDHVEDVPGSSMEGKAVGRTWRVMKEARDAGRPPDFRKVPCERCGRALEDHRVEVQRDGSTLLVYPRQMVAGDTSKGVVNGMVTKARCEDGGKAILTKDYFMSVLPDTGRPCPTITATGAGVGAASVMHPWECRKLTPREALIVSGFPSDYQLTGTREQRYERVGRAVPPPLHRAVSGHLAGLLDQAR